MASSFDQWEKDPFFSAAEEVQESADRMESTYRTWIYEKKDTSRMWNSKEVHRDLQTALGTTKWQLEEFALAVRFSYDNSSNDSKDRHHDFIVAIEDQILKVEKSVHETALSEGKKSLPWVCLDEGERNELALFLSGSSVCANQATEKHRRTVSANVNSVEWKTSVVNNGYLQSSSTVQAVRPPKKIPSVPGYLNSMESGSNLEWPKNGSRKWKLINSREEAESAVLRTPPLPRGKI